MTTGKKRKPIILLTLTNNTDDQLPVSIMADPNPNDIANADPLYQWNITGVVIVAPVTIQFRTIGAAGYITQAVTLQGATASALLASLNALNLGVFWLSTSGGNTYIKTASRVNEYGNLSIGVVSAPSLVLMFNASGTIVTTVTITALTVVTGSIDWGDGEFSYFSQAGIIMLSHSFQAGVQTCYLYVSDNTQIAKVEIMSQELSAISALSNLSSIAVLNVDNNVLTTIDMSGNPLLTGVVISNNKLSQASINASLVALDGFGLLNGTFNSVGQTPAAPPSGAGAVAALSLQGKGWTVVTD